MAVEVSIPYVITGPDGTRAVLNDRDDPDFVGLLNPDDGISGLDSPEVRESSDVLPERDGGVHGNFYHGRRPVVLSGIIWPEGITYATANARAERLARATNAMRADGELRWTETGSVEKRILFRRQQPLRITGRYAKTFQASLVSARAEIESSAVVGLVLDSGVPGATGFVSPLTSPLTSSTPPGGQVLAFNAGSAPAYPFMVISGPITNPRVLNNSTGEEFRLGYDLPAGETLHVDTWARTVLLNGSPGASRYSAVEFPLSVWWALQPGNNDVRLNATASGVGANVAFLFRYAWI